MWRVWRWRSSMMMWRTLLIVTTLLRSRSEAFNLETRIPVVKEGGSYDDSYFGFSVAQHQASDSDKPVILVGAPQDRNLQPGTNTSGALYRCGVSSQTDDCVQVVTDGKRRNDGVYDGSIVNLNKPVREEIKDGQWLGVTVNSQGPGGKVIVCAHRYTVRDRHDSKRGMLGMCYILDSDLTLPRNTNIGARNMLNIREALGGKRLSLLHDFDDHSALGVCQVGTSVSWVKPRNLVNNLNNYALFGAPGCFTWRGNVFGQRTGHNVAYQKAISDDNKLEFTKHGHLGLAVTSGRFFDNAVQFVSGVPNGGRGGTGEINFFHIDKVTDSLRKENTRTLRGGSFGAGFGFSLVTIDVNGDGADDLLVSAPFTDTGGRGGSVYLYVNAGAALVQSRHVEIRGRGPDGQFGLAVTSLGDLNKDGFEDFAVGAPYEGRGVVYVFLGASDGMMERTGESWIKAEIAASQVIRATDLLEINNAPIKSNLNTFGSSLSGGMDLDNNDYPDLVIGAYNSNTIFLLRARPIIDVTTSLYIDKLAKIDPGEAGCELDPDSADACFDFRACFRVESNMSDLGMTIQFQITADPKKVVPRIWLKVQGASEPDEINNRVSHMLNIQEGEREHCTTIVGYVSNDHTDLQSQVPFSLSYSLIQKEPTMNYNSKEPLPVIDQFPILNQQQARRKFYAKFQKNCGDDDVCRAGLLIKSSLHDNETELSKNAKGHYELNVGSLKGNELILKVIVENFGEAAYESTLDVIIPAYLDYINLTPDSELNAPQIINATHYRFDLGNPFRGKSDKGPEVVKIGLRLAPSNEARKTLIKFEFTANTSSELVVDPYSALYCLIVRRAEIRISGVAQPGQQVSYGGEVHGESNLTDLAEIGPKVWHKYTVRNDGPSDVEVISVKIKWPFQVENNKPQGKWLLYLTEHPTVNGNGDCIISGHQHNPLNYSLTKSQESRQPRSHRNLSKVIKETSDDGALRVKREVEQIVAPQRIVSHDPDKPDQYHVHLDCHRGTAKCLDITCQVYNLRSKGSVRIDIRSRLWNSTLVEDYSDIDRVEIYSQAEVIVDPDISQDLTNDQVSVVTVALPDGVHKEMTDKFYWWIYVVAVLCGLMLLVIIVGVLWKCGFFERKRLSDDDTDYMVSANFEKVMLNGNS